MHRPRDQKDSPALATSGVQNLRRSTARLLDLAIFYSLVGLIALVAIPYGTVHPQWQAAFEGVIFFLVALWIVEGLLSDSLQITGKRLLWPLLALALFALVQTLPWGAAGTTGGLEIRRSISVAPFETRLFVFRLLALICAGGLLLRFTNNTRRLRVLIYVVIGVGVASALFGVVRDTSQRDASSFVLSYLAPGRGYGQFINRNHFALLLEMAFGLVVGLVALGGVRRERLLVYLAAIIVLWTTLVLSNSRGGIFSMLGQLLFVALLFTVVRSGKAKGSPSTRSETSNWLQQVSRSLVVRIVLIAGLLFVTAAGVLWVGGDSLAGRLEGVRGEISAEGAEMRRGERRVEIWRSTWQLIKDHPVAGIGFGAYGVAISSYHDASGEVAPQQAHNDYLELLASGGFIGLALLVWFVIALIRQARKRLQAVDPFRRAACFGALVGIFGVAIHSLFDFGLHITVNALVFVVLVVIATAKIGEGFQPRLTRT